MSNVVYLPGCKPKRRSSKNERVFDKTIAVLHSLIARMQSGEKLGIAYISTEGHCGIVTIPDWDEALETVATLRGALMARKPLIRT